MSNSDKECFDFASWTKILPPSEIRELLKYKVKYNFGGGLPGALPIKALCEILISVAQECMNDYNEGCHNKAISLWSYGPTCGHEFLLRVLADRLRVKESINLDKENGWQDVIITTGSQQALYAIIDTLIDPGDVILAARPTYLGFLAPAFKLGAEIVTVPTDLEGIIPEYVEKAILKCRAKFGKNPEILYVVPDSDNPKGTTLPFDRRKALFGIAEQHDLLIIEDQAYREIQFSGEPIKSIKALDKDNTRVAYLRTTSKEAAVLRIGYSVLPQPLKDQVIKNKGYLDLCTPTILQKVMALYYEKYLDKVLPDCLMEYQKRAAAMVKGMDKTFPAGKHTTPTGGFFLWYESEKDFDSKVFLQEIAIPNDILFVPGAAFYPVKGWTFDEETGSIVESKAKTNTMRFGYSFNTEEEIYEGIQKLGNLLSGELS
ncbi:MAG: PLP-dependent aminotransferase family protein [Candidatus Hodarchaeota archaeon]